MIKGESSTLIDRPAAAVWDFMSDLKNAPQWDPGLLEVKQTSPAEFGMGATMQGVMMFLGRPAVLDMVITEWEKDQGATWTIDSAFAKGLARYSISPVGNACKLTRYVQIELKWPHKFLEPLLNFSGKIGHRSERHAELENIKRLVEAGS